MKEFEEMEADEGKLKKKSVSLLVVVYLFYLALFNVVTWTQCVDL